MFTLISIGITVSYVYSLVVLFSRAFSCVDAGMEGMMGLYFEAAAAITTLVSWTGSRARARAEPVKPSGSSTSPEEGEEDSKDGGEEDVPLILVTRRSFAVLPGEKVPTTASCFREAARSTSP